MQFINSYNQLYKNESLKKKLKNSVKSFLINNILNKNFDIQQEYILYPFWHHVFEDEVKNFNLQIKLMQNYGDFISYEDSITILKEGIKSKDRYFCLSFDDGFKNIFHNVIDILLKFNIPCMFFIPTSFINNERDDSGKVFFNNKNIHIEFLSWSDCEKIVSNKLFEIGSHSVNHKMISKLSYEDCLFEIETSKKIIESSLNIGCNHFAPPIGDYSIPRDLEIIKNLKYKSLSTTVRGRMNGKNSDLFAIKRHHLLANWEDNYLKYFFSK